MAHLNDPSDEDLERLLSGMAPADDGFDDLAVLVRDVQSAYMVDTGRAVEDRHVLPIVAAAHLAIDKGNPVVRPASKAHGSARQTSGLPTWRRRTVLSSLFASLGMKVAGVAFAATAATGGLAATGNLPDAAQTAVANVVENIGIHIPNPGDQSAGHRQDASKPEDAGKPADTGKPEDAGKPADTGKPENVGKPENAGKPEDAGDKGVSSDVKDAVNGTYESGKDKGAAVSDAADQNRQDGDHPQSQPTDTPSVSPTIPAGNPTDLGQDSHPTGDSQPDGNPTGIGEDSHPTGRP